LGFDYRTLSQVNPRLIIASITHFGQNGHYKGYKSSDLVDQALGGWLSVTGEAKSPLKLFGNQAYHTASLFAVNGILLAFWQRHTTGRGQYLDVSIMECVAATLDHVLPRYFYEGIVSGRQGSLHWNNAFRVFACKDGYILLSLHQQWETLVEWLASEGMAVDLTGEKWRDREERNRNIDRIIEVLEKWTLSHKVEELVEKGQLMHFPWAEVTAISRKDK
jgi:crotonobetainyl-CoA:carnitine CoA-transferase CaiB-like acyl-CoA transferase